ncbi:CarD family transcriptional regulator [Hyphomicrobium sp.]|mgnify:CR=1 FL=1|uniref:CarD family transcriptional regulator n=1 Tax=Hyphomicrobium sp. TaxID=82 RepID=UPI002BCE98D4|nr:CarD family transcriptional regulator [Hyphomicrobium sp.]HRN87834.1 CarD family transcriptional regulator [Hyphomicrobium sp.]HRQ26635.1 CarD family transcriptional regulator [Hyphomicrobium sp.]
MAQKTKVHAKARTSKPAASKTPARPSAAAKSSAKKASAAPSSHAKKPTAAKVAAAKSAPKKAAAAAPAKKPAAAVSAVKKPAPKTVTATPQKVAPQKTAVKAPPVAAPAAQPARAAAALAKTTGSQKLTAPVQPAAAAAPATPKAIAEKAAAARQIMAAQKKSVSQRHGFKTNEFIVYPAHGVGRIVGIEEQEIAGMSLELFVITFDKEKLTLRVPTGKLESVGMRKLADDGIVKKAMETLKGRARVKRTMWSRRAQEYVAKINSGDLISIAEVVRDLYRSEAQPEQSYSERQLYEDALDRMAREIAAVEKLDERGAVQRITEVLSKSARGRRMAEGADDEVKAA